MAPLRLLAPACCLLLLVALAPPAAADLTVDTQQHGTVTDIWARGASSLAAPQNATLHPMWHGYVIDWTAAGSGPQPTGYIVYRVPSVSTGGSVVATHLPSRWTVTYDEPGNGTYTYFVTALFSPQAASVQVESVPSNPVSTADVNYPHCNVVGIYDNPPYYDSHLACLYPLP
jgi:hypothetical protein